MNLEKLLKLIEESNCYIVDDSPLLNSCAIYHIKKEPENEIIRFSWYDDCAQEFSAGFTEKSLEEAEIIGASIFVKDFQGELSEISLYKTVPIDINKELGEIKI